MKRLLLIHGKWFGAVIIRLLFITTSLAPATAVAQGSIVGLQPDQRIPGTVSIAAALDSSIRAIDALMTEQGAVLLADLRWLGSLGYLCRRTRTDIAREIAKAQANTTELQRMRESGYLDAAGARKIAYALGMEADTLAKQTRILAEELSPTEDALSSADAELEDASRRHQLAVQTLSTMSSALHELAKAIMVNLE